jgi:hypothetical protein
MDSTESTVGFQNIDSRLKPPYAMEAIISQNLENIFLNFDKNYPSKPSQIE